MLRPNTGSNPQREATKGLLVPFRCRSSRWPVDDVSGGKVQLLPVASPLWVRRFRPTAIRTGVMFGPVPGWAPLPHADPWALSVRGGGASGRRGDGDTGIQRRPGDPRAAVFARFAGSRSAWRP